MQLVVLGSGTSDGVPVIGCSCAVCRSPDPRDSRFRSSLLVLGAGGERVLIDSGPEFRLQAIRAGIEGLDGILLTHAHADHIHGLDDVRPLTRRSPLNVYGNRSTLAELSERFAYFFRETQRGGGKPDIRLIPADAEGPDGGAFAIGGLRIVPVPIKHGRLDILGWRVEEGRSAAAYVTDASELPERSIDRLEGLDVLILGALRERAHETHFNFDQALALIDRLRPRRAFLTHLSHDKTHAEIEAFIRLREGVGKAGIARVVEGVGDIKRVEPASDGLRIEVGR